MYAEFLEHRVPLELTGEERKREGEGGRRDVGARCPWKKM